MYLLSPKRSAEHKDARREEILEAARRCFVRSGYDRATLREVAGEAGVSTGALYTYFATKADLLIAICRRQAEDQQAALRDALEQTSAAGQGGHFEAAFGAALAPFLSLPEAEVRRRERMNLLFWYESTREEELGELMRREVGSWLGAVVDGLGEERDAGRLRADLDLDALAVMLVALPFGLQLLDLLGDVGPHREAFVRTVGAVVQRGRAPAGAGEDLRRPSGLARTELLDDAKRTPEGGA